jgi:glycosyltransferase involved in cell wall biosynthesis
LKLSVIIPCLNEEALIPVQLEALANQRWSQPWEVVVADNGSTDQSVTLIERYRKRLPHLRIVDASDRRGRPHALNVGAQAARGELLAFIDADDEVAPGWLAAIGDALSQHDFVASRFDIAKLNGSWLCLGLKHPQETGVMRFRYPPHFAFAGGCGLGVKRAFHEAIGGFDESALLSEDADYCFRMQLAGIKLHFVPDAVVYVRYPNTLSGVYRQVRGWGEYQVFLYKKYRPASAVGFTWKHAVHGWIRLLKRLPQIRTKRGRFTWIRLFGWRLGRLRGSIRYWTLLV